MCASDANFVKKRLQELFGYEAYHLRQGDGGPGACHTPHSGKFASIRGTESL